ncbi:UTRA domain-containing protein [Streptomyces sp. NBC_00690]|uniref:UTRA domain-containing protein n=1 Tax=Streptomyces sp. NBC_00690 TaxID=2975808 RepID=UPI002E2AAC10|nr:UTRA domain-containing protein [Streptomyces sp. NBC_00690]
MSTGEWINTSTPYLAPRPKGQGEAWGAETAMEGRQGRQRILYAGEASAPRDVAERLGLHEGDAVVVRRRLMLLDGRPCELTDSYYSTEIARNTRLAQATKIPGGAVTYLAGLGYVGARAREDVSARMPHAHEREALCSGDDEPVLQVVRTTLDRDDNPIQVDVMIMLASSQRLQYEIRIG